MTGGKTQPPVEGVSFTECSQPHKQELHQNTHTHKAKIYESRIDFLIQCKCRGTKIIILTFLETIAYSLQRTYSESYQI